MKKKLGMVALLAVLIAGFWSYGACSHNNGYSAGLDENLKDTVIDIMVNIAVAGDDSTVFAKRGLDNRGMKLDLGNETARTIADNGYEGAYGKWVSLGYALEMGSPYVWWVNGYAELNP